MVGVVGLISVVIVVVCVIGNLMVGWLLLCGV